MSGPELLGGSAFSLLVFSTLLGLLPFALLLLTAFMKISVVFYILRNAIGLQQTPSNLILSAVAAILALFISAPVVTDVYAELRNPKFTYKTVGDWEQAANAAVVPVKVFLEKQTSEVDRKFFALAAEQVWGKEKAVKLDDKSMFVLVPAFVMHELTAAFKIGFMLYLPFLAIDIIVANILMALGMMVMSPTVIAVPFKLFLFVAIDGWNLLVRGLITSYAPL
jgi:type III secretion protein R